MTAKRRSVPCPREPIGLSLDEAATYIGVSPSLFEEMISEGRMPPPHEYRRRLIWDADEVAAAFRRRLPRRKVDLKPGAEPMHFDEPEESPFDEFQA